MDTEVIDLNKRGIRAVMNGNSSHAEKCFNEALSLNANSLDSIFNLVKLFYMQKRSLDVTALYLKNIPSHRLAYIPPPIVLMVANCFADQLNFGKLASSNVNLLLILPVSLQ